jgi:hypothetical protein
MELDTQPSDQQKPREKTEFAKRNPHLERLVPDAIENAVDALIPDRFEKVMVAWDPVTILTRHCRSRLCWCCCLGLGDTPSDSKLFTVLLRE